jgi:hypothetical protein
LAEDRRAAEMSTQWLQSAQTQSKSIREPVNDTRRDGREFGGTSQRALCEFMILVFGYLF